MRKAPDSILARCSSARQDHLANPMSAFPDWQKFAVTQRHLSTGCIPTGYEMILRAAGRTEVDFTRFQEEFDLDLNTSTAPRNHFVSVANAVKVRYPALNFTCEFFKKGEGAAKVRRMEERVAAQQPLLVSIANEPFGGPGWHIMLLVDSTVEDFTFLEYLDGLGQAHTRTLPKSQIAVIHDRFLGGDEIAYLNPGP